MGLWSLLPDGFTQQFYLNTEYCILMFSHPSLNSIILNFIIIKLKGNLELFFSDARIHSLVLDLDWISSNSNQEDDRWGWVSFLELWNSRQSFEYHSVSNSSHAIPSFSASWDEDPHRHPSR